MTPPRQVWIFKLGCWIAFAAAVVHLLGHLVMMSSSGNRPAAGWPNYLFPVPGQTVPSNDDVADGLSLSFSLLLATLAGAGVVVAKRGQADALLLRGVARAYALGGAVLLVVSVVMFFSIQSFAIAAMTLCFALGAVTET